MAGKIRGRAAGNIEAMQCPKCGAEAREVARFCARCHQTLRFECPACKHEQRHGGGCDACGVDFMKYVGAVMAAKKNESDAAHEKSQSRSALLKHLLWSPVTGGFPLLKHFFGQPHKNRKE